METQRMQSEPDGEPCSKRQRRAPPRLPDDESQSGPQRGQRHVSESDQGCHRRVEQFKADGTLLCTVCCLGTLHVIFAVIKCIFDVFDPVLHLARIVEQQLNVKFDRGEHVTKIAHGHCDFTAQTIFELASAFAMREIGDFLDETDRTGRTHPGGRATTS